MRWLPAFAVCLVLTALSGCLEADAGGTGDDESTSNTASSTSSSRAPGATSATGTTTSASTSGSLANATANLTASVLNGTAPLNVTFTLDGTAPGNLTWTLESNGTELANGTALPTNVTHGFNQTGNVTVVLTVSGASGNAMANVTLVILEGAALAPAEEVVLCPTDTDAIEIPGAHLYITPRDNFASPGALWIYEESNGMPGLQRNDDTRPTDCPTPDTIIF